ncbi:MAG: glycoside hydrolase family 20 protein [Saprospiraceae bacterium]|nr:glycoside hydrolase family 20 protein [Saprospiraceae bacterium]
MSRLWVYLFFLPLLANCQPAPNLFNIIPLPQSIEARKGVFTLKKDTRIFVPEGQADWELAAQFLTSMAGTSTTYRLVNTPFKKFKEAKGNSIYFLPDPTILTDEGYVLEVKNNAILIRAKTAAGAFYAVQTLRQLFPPEFGGTHSYGSIKWVAPCCLIQDAPRFSYRGMHLDVGRHFFPPVFVKKYIDLLAMHKFNTFHWHLTEDQGWRIEIKKYPELQRTASCRKETLIGHYNDQPHRFDGKKYCGFYTQREIKDIVEYAQKRFVTIVPEIELPGHSMAALSAYPELGCTGGPYEAATKWGVFDDVYCAGNDQTFAFLDDVMAEVCALFPSSYIHIGGDECPKTRWEACAKCKKRMKDEGLKDAHELQSYFIRRMEKTLALHNRKIIGWDEILEGGLAPTATVMSWRGTEGGIAAAKAGHDAIMTPGSHCYFDHYQSDPATEPVAIGGLTTLEKAYAYEPIPEGLTDAEAKHILGAQGNVWTEYMPKPEQVEYMAFPRACALSEVVWSPKNKRNWSDFSRRIQPHFTRLDAANVKFARSFYDVTASFSNNKVTLKTNDPAVEIRYTTDGKPPSANSPKYISPVPITKTTTLKAASFAKNRPLGKSMTVQYTIHKAIGKSYAMPRKPDQYTGGDEFGLTNGITGGIKTWNNWVGLVNHDIDPVIDFGQPTAFGKVSFNFVNAKDSWIWPPKGAEVYASDDGVNFKLLTTKTIDVDALQGATVENVVLETPNAKARYLKFVAKTYGVIPKDEPGAGNGAWLFVDEVVVE